MKRIIKYLAREAEFSEKDIHIQGDNFQRFAELIAKELSKEILRNHQEEDMTKRDEGFSSGLLIAAAIVRHHFELNNND